ncbi:hypothetical protein [Pectobacterium wasabiae]|uniref:Uncharacterized protein n=1 Tax=Pectobacterium wasabiae TaxID=55208 RepID=A0AAW3EIW6_9GAMM|nr:hypothetical protein [Pectobacterium wasabiae]AOR64125.1 hypothetical protein A7983_12810 [Pectobacterium wasabiae CFBP 3304]EJS94524.1 Hypothetical protein Y17_2579 [Pectobacterium wasabiae CFBP 3304]KFX08744.1 hypothetical protein JV38_08455 [Pectobacterium wasabiae]KGA28771.1 hypothetical protein KU73_12175 [Pectobacterium wasabiae]
MKNNLNLRFINLSERLNASYANNYLSDEDEYLENKKIKSEIVCFICDAHTCGEQLLVEEAFKLLLDNTGCQEDFEILEEILSPVFKKKVIDNELLKEYLKDSPLFRWL